MATEAVGQKKSVCERLIPVMRIIETVVARLLVIFHVGLLIFRGIGLGKNVYFTLPLSSCVFLVIPEAIFTYTKTKASEWKWLCPCILLFTLSTLPQIWMLEMDMNQEKRIQQEENRKSAVEVAIEMQRQANVDPEQCSLKKLLPADEWEKMEEEMGIQNPPQKQERNKMVLNIPQKWKQQVTLTSNAAKEEDLGLMIDENLETADASKCWRAFNKTTTIVFDFNQVLVIKRVILYTGRHSFGPKSVILIPLETVDGRIIRERDKRFKYAMEATKKQDGSYTLDLQTNIRSTTVFQYLELSIRPSGNSDTVICEIDLEYSNNYLASNGRTEFYQPAIKLDISTGSLYTPDKTKLVQRFFDDKLSTCSTFKKIKLKVEEVHASSYVSKQLTFFSLVLVPQATIKSSSYSPGGMGTNSAAGATPLAPVVSVSSTDQSLLSNITLSEEYEIDLPPRISKGNTVITIESYNNSQELITLCEVRLHAKVEEDPPRISEGGSRRPTRDAGLDSNPNDDPDPFHLFLDPFSAPSSSEFQSAQQIYSAAAYSRDKRSLDSVSHALIESSLEHSRLARALFIEGGGSRIRRNAEPFQPKSVFMLLDASQEMKATITLVMEQLTMVTLLFIRWIIPRPVSMNPEQLAGCLAGWMGMMADQLNFLVLLDEDPVITHPYFFYVVLCLFSFSQVQFSFVYPARLAVDPSQPQTLRTRLFGSFLWQSICVLCLQDVPFMIVRIISITHLKVLNHTVAYFIGKNIIVVSLQVYRMAWLLLQEKWAREEQKKRVSHVKVKIEDKRNGYPNWNMEDMSHLPWIDDVVADDIKRTRNSIVIANGGGGGGGGNKMDDVDDEPGEKESLL